MDAPTQSVVTASRYHPVLVTLHWALALLIIVALAGGALKMAPMANTNPMKLEALRVHMTGASSVISLIPPLCFSQQCLFGYDAEGPRAAEQRMPLSSRSVRKLQRSLDRLEARLVAQRIEEGVNFRVREIRVPVPHRGLEPIERACSIAPLRVDVRVSLGQPISRNGPNLGKHRLGLGVSPELVVDHCQAPGSIDFACSFTRSTGALEVSAHINPSHMLTETSSGVSAFASVSALMA